MIGTPYCPVANGERETSETMTTNTREARTIPWRRRGLICLGSGVVIFDPALFCFSDPGMNTMRSAVLEDIISCQAVVSEGVTVIMGSVSVMASRGSVVLVESCDGKVYSVPEESMRSPVMTT